METGNVESDMKAEELPNSLQLDGNCLDPEQGHLQGEEMDENSGNDGESLLHKYDLIKVLSNGIHRKVMLAKSRSAGGPGSRPELFAIKSVRKEYFRCSDFVWRGLIEKAVLIHAVGHPFLVQMHSCIQTK